MEAARRLFTTVTPPASTPAAEELVKRDQHSEECCLKIGWLSLRNFLPSRQMLTRSIEFPSIFSAGHRNLVQQRLFVQRSRLPRTPFGRSSSQRLPSARLGE